MGDVELEPLVTRQPKGGLSLTAKNDNQPRKGLYGTTACLDPVRFEEFDHCYVFSKHAKKPDGIIPAAQVHTMIINALRARQGVDGLILDTVGALHSVYGLSPSEIDRDYTRQEFQDLVYRVFVYVLQFLKVHMITEDSACGTKTLIRVRMPESSCRRVADLKSYPLQMDDDVTSFAEFKEDPNFVPPFIPFETVIEEGPAHKGGAMERIGRVFQRYDRLSRPMDAVPDTPEAGMFRDVDRIRLLDTAVFEFVNCEYLMKHKWMSASFALSQPVSVEALRHCWGNFMLVWSWNQPLDQIKDYFGEEIALYFAWLGFYCKMLVAPAVVGTLLFVLQQLFDNEFEFNSRFLNIIRVGFCVFMAAWGSIFFQLWQRKQKMLSLKWGIELVGGSARSPKETPWFKHDGYARDPVRPDLWRKTFAPKSRAFREMITSVIVIAATLASILVVNDEITDSILATAGFSGMTGWSEKVEHSEWVGFFFSLVAIRYVITFLTAIAIKILDFLWERLIAYNLASFENHQYMNRYQDSVSYKVFFYKFFNNFSVLFFLAYFRDQFSPCEDMEDGRCIRSLRRMLISLFLVDLTNNFSEVMMPMVKYYIKKLIGTKFDSVTSHEAQFYMTPYSKKAGITSDWLDMMSQFGFLSLFSLVYPLLPLLAFGISMVEIRSDAFKLCSVHRRPFPGEASDIGAWEDIQRAMTFASVVNNIFLVTFVTIGYSQSLTWKLGWSIILLLVGLGVKEYIVYRVPEKSKRYNITKARMNVVSFEAVWGEKDVTLRESK